MRCGVYVRVSTDDQRDNGYSIDSQLRMIKEYCEKNNYSIVDVYNDAGQSGKDLMRPEMQRLLKDIKSHKIEVIVAIKVARLTRNNYDGFWFLNYCEERDVKIELILEPYDVSTANGEMIFGMNLVFWQRERKEIGNSIYIGIFEYGKYCRKSQNILRVENYCEPIVDIETWNITRKVLERNKHSTYGEHIHLFTGIVRCPTCYLKK